MSEFRNSRDEPFHHAEPGQKVAAGFRLADVGKEGPTGLYAKFPSKKSGGKTGTGRAGDSDKDQPTGERGTHVKGIIPNKHRHPGHPR